MSHALLLGPPPPTTPQASHPFRVIKGIARVIIATPLVNRTFINSVFRIITDFDDGYSIINVLSSNDTHFFRLIPFIVILFLLVHSVKLLDCFFTLNFFFYGNVEDSLFFSLRPFHFTIFFSTHFFFNNILAI